MTLPGFETIPDPAPGKTATGYLTWLHQNTWPGEWQFWCLAGTVGRAETGCEWVVLVRGRELQEARVDLATGAVTKWGERL